MAVHPPRNPRVVYPDGTVRPIRELWYGACICGTHVWIAESPQFVRWGGRGTHTEYDDTNPDEQHFIVIGYDLRGVIDSA